MALHPCLHRDSVRRTWDFAPRKLRASCHKRAPEPCSWVYSFVEWFSPFPLSVCPSCLSKTSYTCSKYSFFFPCIAQTGYEPDLFILTSIVVHTAKIPCTNKAYFFVWIEKFDLVRLFPSVATIPHSRREEAWDHFERCRSSVCSVLHARLVMNTMRLRDGGLGRGRSCVAMTI